MNLLSVLLVAATIHGHARVIDGDTIDIGGQRLRLFGIDAPEKLQRCGDKFCGQIATAALDWLVAGKMITCTPVSLDKYARTVALCQIDALSINEWMVRHGYAVAYRDYSTKFLDAETSARQEKRGMWSGDFEYPWDYRRRHRVGGVNKRAF